MSTQYCCFSNEVGVTLIGFFHLNAALFFWARFTTFEPIYMWLDLLVAICYTLRATYFFIMVAADSSAQSRTDYFDMNKYTAYGLAACGFAFILLNSLEWSHWPVWVSVAWLSVGVLNWYHYEVLASYAGQANLLLARKLADASPLEVAKEAQQLVFITKLE